MCALTVLKVAHCQGCAGSGVKAGPSSLAKRLARQPSSFWNGRLFSDTSSAEIAASAACTSASTVCRSRARIQRVTTCTADSAVALSLGEYGRAGRIDTA